VFDKRDGIARCVQPILLPAPFSSRPGPVAPLRRRNSPPNPVVAGAPRRNGGERLARRRGESDPRGTPTRQYPPPYETAREGSSKEGLPPGPAPYTPSTNSGMLITELLRVKRLPHLQSFRAGGSGVPPAVIPDRRISNRAVSGSKRPPPPTSGPDAKPRDPRTRTGDLLREAHAPLAGRRHRAVRADCGTNPMRIAECWSTHPASPAGCSSP